ncbi:MAG: hypothetical protein RBT69_11815 [Spirochaetia bacterium]|jgi:tetratricopeptide (TPR) repeat protein|nr:hypothetical protein [Spirochaetia bacterium]
MILKYLMIGGFVAVIIFLAKIYPNLKKTKWERKIISAGYLRARKHRDLADDVIIKGIKEEPSAWQLYVDLFRNYSSPWDMKKLFDVISSGFKITDHPGTGAAEAWCLIEEGVFDKALEILNREDVKDYMIEYNLPYLSRLYFKQEKYAECEKAFISFYKKIYDDESEPEEKKLFGDLSAEEIIILLCARRKLEKPWKKTAKIIPVKSLHEEDDWSAYYERLLDEEKKLKVETGIYGPPENVYTLRKKELDEKLETVKELLGKK